MHCMSRKGKDLDINFPGCTGAARKRPILSHFSEHNSYTVISPNKLSHLETTHPSLPTSKSVCTCRYQPV